MDEVFQKTPDFAKNPETAIELIYTEYATREELGQTPPTADYFARFPDLRGRLERQFQIHEIVRQQADETRTDEATASSHKKLVDSGSEHLPKMGDYQILGERARGSAATIYKVRHVELDRTVALKIFPPQTSSSLDRGFIDEAKTLAKLHHPNIVQLFESGCTPEGQAYLALEWIDGKSLAEQLDTGLPPWRESASLIAKSAEAVLYAHRSGIVHRDLKPGNILLTLSGVPKVSDFGLARWIHEDSSRTSEPAVQGTPSYMAPEQVRDPASAGPAADIYSLGAILYELLTGRPPFLSDTPIETLRQVLTETPIHPLTLQPAAPKDLATIALKCLSKEPSARYRDAAALGEDLARFLDGQPVLARPVPPWERAWKWACRKPASAALLATAVVVPLMLYVSGIWYVAWLREARNDADQQRKIAQHQSELVHQQLERQKRLAYTLQVGRAYSLHRRNPSTALSLLENESVCPPDLREFSWRLVHRLIPRAQHTFPGGSLAAWSPDGKRLATGGPQGELLIRSTGDWRIAIENRNAELSGMRSIAWSLDGKMIATGDSGKTTLWDASTCIAIATLPGRGGPVIGLAFSPDSQHLLAVSFRPGTALLWNLGDRTSEPLIESDGFLHSAAFSPDGRLVAITGETVGVRLLETSTWNQIRHLQLEGAGAFLDFSPDGSQLAVGAWEHGVYLYDTETWQPRHHLPVELSRVRALDYSWDGSFLATANQDASLRIWDLSTQQEVQDRRGHSRVVWSVAFSPDGNRIATGSKDRSVRIWNTDPGSPNPETLLHVSDRVLSLDISKLDGGWLATDTAAGVYRQGHLDLPGSGESVIQAAVSDDGARIGLALRGQSLKLVDLGQPEEASFVELIAQGEALAFSTDGSEMAVGFRDGKIHCFDFDSCEPTRQFDSQFPVTALVYSPHGNAIYAGHRTGSLSRIDLITNTATPLPIEGHTEAIRALAFSPSGEILASGGEDALVLMMDTDDHSIRYRLDQHTHSVNSVEFSPDGRTLASGTGDRWVLNPGEVNLWDVGTGQKIISLENQSGPVAFSADGMRLYTSTEDAGVRVWKAE